MANKKKPIPDMPTENWYWETGPYTYESVGGVTVHGKGKHFHNIQTGENLTTRQGQKLQKQERIRRGITVPGRTPKVPYRSYVRYRHVPTATGRPAQHGPTVNIYYKTLEDAFLDFQILYADPNSFIHAYRAWVIEVSWEDKLVSADTNITKKKIIKTGRKTAKGKDIYRTAPLGYATLSTQYHSLATMGQTVEPWLEAEVRLQNYSMGNNGRIILFGGER